MKFVLLRAVLALGVALTTGCTKAEPSDARRGFLLAADHGWIDLTVTLPTLALQKDARRCTMEFTFNGESALGEMADLAAAKSSNTVIGYRFPVPAGALQAELRIGDCVKEAQFHKLPLTMKKDHLALLAFDGEKLTSSTMEPYEPSSLESMRTQMLQLEAKTEESATASTTSVAKLTRIALGSLALNLLALMLMVWQWRTKPGKR